MTTMLKTGLLELPLGRRRLRLDLVLLLILLAASCWRLNGLDWGWTDFDPAVPGATGPGRFHAFHPDEASNLRAARLFTESDSWRPTGELYGEKVDYSLYGASTLYLHVAVVKLRAWFGGVTPFDEKDPASFRATWLAVRWLTALLGLGCILLLYQAAFTLHGRAAARLAALLLAGAAFHAQSGRFGTVDMPMVFFTLWSFAHSARLARTFAWRDLLLAALAAGLAMATKVNAVGVVLPLVAAQLVRDPWPDGAASRGREVLRRLLGGPLWAAAGVTVGVFFLLNPYAVLDWRSFLFADHAFGLMHILRNVRGEFFYPFQIQFEDISPFPFLLGNVLWWAAGPALLLAGLAGMLFAAWRRRPGDWLLLSWFLPGLLLTAGAKVLFMRYALPFLPLLALGAAVLLAALLEQLRGAGGRVAAWLAVALVALPSLGWTAALAAVHNREDSRISAGRWLAANLPQGARLLHERSANSIKPVIHMPRYHNVCMEIPTVYRATGNTEAEKLDFLVDRLRQVDWAAILESNRKLGYQRTPHYPAERRFYEELFAGKLGFVTDTVFQVKPRVLGVEIDDEPAEFSLRYYDHEEIHILRKTDPAALEAGLLRLREEMARTPGTVDQRLARAEELLAAGRLQETRDAAVALLEEADLGQRAQRNRAYGQARALVLVARVFEASALQALEAGQAEQAAGLVREAEGLFQQALQMPGAPLGMDGRAADWVEFRARLLGPEAARELLGQALQGGLEGPRLRALAMDLGLATSRQLPPDTPAGGEE